MGDEPNKTGEMVKHNNVIPNGHFKKEWETRVKTWFNQPARKLRRREARRAKAARIAPRPLAGLARPVVQCPSRRYNSRARTGRGFTLEELKAAGVSKKAARTIGIAVDHRRKNRCEESLQTNVQRLKTYKSKLILFPLKAGKPQPGDASEAQLSAVSQHKGAILPLSKKSKRVPARKIRDAAKNFDAVRTLQHA